ncbi:MAG TPA: radical SAM protein [bacterium (Candidatus Stahlbacteria)]|nr:radical SAM protein [Candidatus Stahlbacteria bacterium]
MYPSYLNLTQKELKERIDRGYAILKSCTLCARNCKVDRLANERGFCRAGALPVVSSYNLHFGEEPPISGDRGSGTIFFTHCSMRCCFCQNYPISQKGIGNEVSIEELSVMMLKLQERGVHNINLVTPTHFVPQIISALKIAIEKGLNIPIVYNTGGYDSLETLKLLDGIVDIYMPDAKYGDNKDAEKYSIAPNYVDANVIALKEMHSQVGDLILNDGIAKRGILVRHLVLPNNISEPKEVLHTLHSISKDMYVSLMSQYFPCNRADEYPELARKITKKEYEEARKEVEKLSLRGYIQEI